MGIYNAALRVKLLPETFLGMLIAPMLPIFSESFGKRDHLTFQRTFLFNFTLAVLIIIPVSCVHPPPRPSPCSPLGPLSRWVGDRAMAHAPCRRLCADVSHGQHSHQHGENVV